MAAYEYLEFMACAVWLSRRAVKHGFGAFLGGYVYT